MGKRTTTIYIDDDLLEIAKSKRINISKLVNDVLKETLEINVPDHIGQLISEEEQLKKEMELARNKYSLIKNKLEKMKKDESEGTFIELRDHK